MKVFILGDGICGKQFLVCRKARKWSARSWSVKQACCSCFLRRQSFSQYHWPDLSDKPGALASTSFSSSAFVF
tara:strand:- start:455 stop:673 length:219 start_codon:yes stop_codon:yes gene_type:complete